MPKKSAGLVLVHVRWFDASYQRGECSPGERRTVGGRGRKDDLDCPGLVRQRGRLAVYPAHTEGKRPSREEVQGVAYRDCLLRRQIIEQRVPRLRPRRHLLPHRHRHRRPRRRRTLTGTATGREIRSPQEPGRQHHVRRQYAHALAAAGRAATVHERPRPTTPRWAGTHGRLHRGSLAQPVT